MLQFMVVIAEGAGRGAVIERRAVEEFHTAVKLTLVRACPFVTKGGLFPQITTTMLVLVFALYMLVQSVMEQALMQQIMTTMLVLVFVLVLLMLLCMEQVLMQVLAKASSPSPSNLGFLVAHLLLMALLLHAVLLVAVPPLVVALSSAAQGLNSVIGLALLLSRPCLQGRSGSPHGFVLLPLLILLAQVLLAFLILLEIVHKSAMALLYPVAYTSAAKGVSVFALLVVRLFATPFVLCPTTSRRSSLLYTALPRPVSSPMTEVLLLPFAVLVHPLAGSWELCCLVVSLAFSLFSRLGCSTFSCSSSEGLAVLSPFWGRCSRHR